MPIASMLQLVGLGGAILSLAMMVPLGVAAWIGDALALRQFGLSIFALGVFSGLLLVATRQQIWLGRETRNLAWLGVGLWLWLPIAGALPLWGWQGFDWSMAWFESVSFFTTTSTTLDTNLIQAGAPMLVWRAILTGLGAVWSILFLLMIAIPLGIGGLGLHQRMAGDIRTRLVARWSVLLWMIAWRFAALVALGSIGFLLLGLPPDLAVWLGLSGVATAGFVPVISPLSQSVSEGALLWLSLLMLLGAMSFPIWIYWGRMRSQVQHTELWAFCIWSLVVGAICIIWMSGNGVAGLATGLAQAANLVSTSGLRIVAISDTANLSWLLLPCIIGGMSLSSAGGIKLLRVLLGAYSIQKELGQLTSPLSIASSQFLARADAEAHSRACWAYIAGYLLCLVCGIVLAALLMDSDFSASLRFVLAQLSSVNMTSLTPQSDAPFTMPGRILGGVLMLVGRLEILLFFLLLFPSFWRR